MKQSIDARAQVLANCQFLYGVGTEIITYNSEKNRHYSSARMKQNYHYHAVAVKQNLSLCIWEKYLCGESTVSSQNAVASLLDASEQELYKQISTDETTTICPEEIKRCIIIHHPVLEYPPHSEARSDIPSKEERKLHVVSGCCPTENVSNTDECCLEGRKPSHPGDDGTMEKPTKCCTEPVECCCTERVVSCSEPVEHCPEPVRSCLEPIECYPKPKFGDWSPWANWHVQQEPTKSCPEPGDEYPRKEPSNCCPRKRRPRS